MTKYLNISVDSCTQCLFNSRRICGLDSYIEHCAHNHAPRTSWIMKENLIDGFPTWCPLEEVKK